MTSGRIKALVAMTSPLDGIAHALRVVASIREQRPDVEITWVVRDMFEPLVASFACVDRTVTFHRKEGLLAWFGLARRLRAERYDLALDFEGHARSALMGWIARSGRRIGMAHAREGATILYRELLHPPGGAGAHLVDAMNEFSRAFGLAPRLVGGVALKSDCKAPEAWNRESDCRRVCLFPGRFKKERAWSGMFDLARRLLEERGDARVYFLGVAPKVEVPRELKAAFGDRVHDLQDRVDWPQTLAMLRECDLTVCNDNGGSQIASLFGRPNLTLYTLVDPARRGSYPVADPRNAVARAPGGRAGALSLDAVWSEVEKLLPV